MDLAAELAERWNRSCGAQAPANAEDFWPLLRILADAGLVTGREEALTTLQLGPFRLAQTPYETATRDFLDVLLPSIVVGSADGRPVHGTVAGALAAVTRGFIELLRRGIVFGRSPADRLRWEILIHTKERSAKGEYPTVNDVVAALGRPDAPGGRTERDIRAAVEWLLSGSPQDGRSRPALISRDGDDRLSSLV